MNDSMISQVLASLRDRAGGRIVVAVSGGADSVGLLRLLHLLTPELRLTLTVAYVDHGVRPESADDARFVSRLAESLGLPFDAASWQPTRVGHFETDARAARYELLAEIARRRVADAVAVGHTKDDQAETILHRVLRGTGPRGLSGMPAARRLVDGITLIRPLLDVGRDAIREALALLDQPFREDPTNDDRRHTRNRVRNELLPLLADQYNPRIVDALIRLGRLAGERERDEERRTRRTARRIVASSLSSDVIRLDQAAFRRLSPRRRAELLRYVWRAAGWPEREMDGTRWQRLATLGDRPGRRASIGAGVEAKTDDAFLTLSRSITQIQKTKPLDEMSLDIPGAIRWDDGQLFTVVDPDTSRDETIDLDRIEPPLTVRSPRPGDRFTPLGMEGSTSLNDFFRGRGIGREMRPMVPLLCDRAGIVWVVGQRIADRVRRTVGTSRTLGLLWVPDGCD